MRCRAARVGSAGGRVGQPQPAHRHRTATPLALTGPARDLVHALKFRSVPGVAALMAAHVVHALPAGFFDPGATIVPVPAHPARRRRRGYDHADALARAIAARTGQQVAARARPGRRTRRTSARARGAPRACAAARSR